MKTFCVLSLFSILVMSCVSAQPQPVDQRRLAFNDEWRFFKGEAANAETPAFDDSNWRHVQLPHDWAIEGPFDPKFNPHTGGLQIYGTGWYRKHFVLPATKTTRYYSIEFDGAMSNAQVWLNGHELGGRPYGYIGFSFDLTPHLNPAGKTNVLAVRLSPEDHSSRWYPGAGIYRNVWLDATGPVHVARWGTYLTTPEISDSKATVSIRTDVENRKAAAAHLTVETAVYLGGKEVARTTNPLDVANSGQQTIDARLSVPNPQRWDVDHPTLYVAVTTIKDGSQVVDTYATPFGIRTIEFDKTKGFLLNGRHLKLQGVCNHHDLGALGAAVSRRATERQLQIMKSMGVNAIRTSHNPPSPELLEYCDRLGLLVMDEAFDMWRLPKVKNGYSKYFDEWSDRDLKDMLHRDRNHPSIIMWSIGNEIPEQHTPDGWKIAKHLTEICHQEDRTRPTTSAFDQDWNAIKNGMAAQVDLPGFNYKPFDYEKILQQHPDWIILGTETSSCVSSRGAYHLPIEKYQKHPSHELTSYDVIAPPWAYCPDPEFAEQQKLQNVLGEFVWTGFDYLGEPTPYFMGLNSEADWPARSSYFGVVDLAGFPKDRFYLYQSVWTKAPMVHILPHWNWPGREGQNIPVLAYTNADEVELFLNGKSLGRRKHGQDTMVIPVGDNISKDHKYTTKYRLLWDVPYAAGTLRAVAYQAGKQVAQDEVRTAGPAAQIKLTPDRSTIQSDGDDLSFITVRVEDRNGVLCPDATNLVQFKLEGPGHIAGVDNGNSATVEPFQADYRKAFHGLALLIVRTERGKSGSIRITATSSGLSAGQTVLTSR